MRAILILSAFCAISCASDFVDNPDVELPSYMRICNRDDPELGRCIKDSIQRLLPELHNGIQSIGFPAIDPFSQESSYFEYKNDQIYGSLHIKNAKTYGMSRALIRDVRATAEDDAFRMEVDVNFPKLITEGKFKGEGRFNSIKVTSKGYFNITTSNVSTTWKITGSTTERNGEEYMFINKFDMTPEVGDMKIYATGLFPDPGLNQVALDFVNQYWPALYKQMLPETRRSWEPIMLEVINKMFDRVPYRRLLPKAESS
ncbi:putative beta-carotene-binding protein [Toxorhynchites rutilus septentrionalis]|uniref:putative beta-carotene-binding protein n=1 Tax=Toxorhynchites rutilus septentrionalis TaxID=329112 RepID=UPI0024785497|nr:putative beta-carotene-binding protein [Toxorhynchites rutilus septentrionalis]